MTPALEETIYIDFTISGATGAAADADSTPTAAVFEDANDTAILSPTVTKRTSLTGHYRVPIACTAANGFEEGKSYNVAVSATIGSIAAKSIVGTFQIRSTVKATDSKGNPLVPLSAGQVIRRSADGTVTYYTPASGTAAARGDAIIAAKNAASSGETIFIFFDATVTETLWADGVNWYIAEGCNLHGTAAEGLFVDAATGEGGDPLVPATFSINGGGVITSTSVPIIAGVNSKIRVHCRSLTATTGTNQAVNASGSGAEIWITATEKIQSAGYDCLLATSGGKIHVWTPYCQSAGVGANCVDIANTGSIVDGWVGRMKSEDPAINCISSGGIVNLVIGSIEVATDKSLVNNGCDVKIVCPSIVGQVVHTTGNTRLVGPTTIDTTAFSLASVTVAASGLVLENARIVTKSSETNSMSAASAQTVQVARAIEYNKALSNVTLSYVDSVGVIGTDAITAAAIAANAIGASEIADGAIDTATFAAGTTVPRVTLVDTTTTLTEDIAAQIDATAVADAVYNRFAAGAPVVSDSQQYAQRSIVKGNSYSSADRDFIITLANGAEWPTDLSSYSWTYTADIHADNNNTGGSGYASVTGSATVVTATGDTRSIRITLPSTTTGIMAIGFYTHSLRGTASGGRAWTVELGTLEVKADPAV